MRPQAHASTRFVATLLMLLVPLSLALGSAPTASAARPGEILASVGGSLDPLRSNTIPFFSPGPANFRLEVSGGVVTDTIQMTLNDGSASPPRWTVRSGEVIWAFGNIPTNGQIILENRSNTVLTYDLKAYARGVVPNVTQDDTIWSGVVRSGGTRSAIQVTVATAGMYRFALDASEGSYQLQVDNNTVLKTVVTDSEPDANADTIYYLTAGVHTLSLLHNDSAPQTRWSVSVSTAGTTADALPVIESSKILGGPAFPSEEWIPIQITNGQRVNIKIEVTGGVSNSLVVQLLNGGTAVFTSANTFGGEISWASSTVITGANALRVTTAGTNNQPLGYRVTLTPIAATPLSWAGTSYGLPSHPSPTGRSTVLLTFPTAGLYQFSLGASSGRYQFILNNGHLQKTIVATTTAEFTAYVPEGTLPLLIAQDPAATTTTWSVGITKVDQVTDSLPYARNGVTLGGINNAFVDEWLPLQAAAAAPVNLNVVATSGAVSDSLVIEFYNGETLVYKADRVYSGETFWATSNLVAAANRLHISAAVSNTLPMSYQLSVQAIPTMPTRLQGVSLKDGLNSTVRINAPVTGTYDLVLTMTEGLGLVLVDPQTGQVLSPQTAASTSILRVPLTAGLHTFRMQQDSRSARTVWDLAAQLRLSDAPLNVSTITPTLIPLGQAVAVTLNGQGFDNSTKVELVAADGAVTALTGVVVSPTQIIVDIPSTLAKGTFSLRLSNDSGTTVTIPQSFSVGERALTKTFVAFVLT